MRQQLKKVIIFLFVLLLFPGLKANAEVFDLYTGEVKGAYRDLTVTKVEDKYFLHKEDLLPGDVIKGKYEISNTSTKAYELTLKSLTTSNSPTSWIKNDQEEVPDDWIKDINLKLTLDGEVIYDGSATGKDNLSGESNDVKKLTDGIYLGKINQNTKKTLEAEFTIPENLDNDYQEAWARVDWIFSAKWATSGGGGGRDPKPTPAPTPTPDPTPAPEPTPDPGEEEKPPLPPTPETEEPPFEIPDTGDGIADMIIYIVIMLGAISGIFLVIFSKKKE